MFSVISSRYAQDEYQTTVGQFIADCKDQGWTEPKLTLGTDGDGHRCYRDETGEIVLIQKSEA